MINLKQELQNYPFINLAVLEAKNPKMPDNIKNSIMLYNKSLENLRTDNEDIAIIELRKALSMNPDFHEAMNLLGICYSYTKEYAKAAQIFEKVAASESNGVKAMDYLKQLNIASTTTMIPAAKKKSKANKKESNNANDSLKKVLALGNFKKNSKADMARYVVGFICGVLVVCLFSFTFYFTNVKGENSQNSAITTNASPNDVNISEADYNKLNDDYKKLQTNLATANAEADYGKSIAKLLEIEKLATGKSYEAAADKLILLKTIKFIGFEKEKFDSLYNDIIPKAAWALYVDGTNLYSNAKYKDSVSKLSKIQAYGGEWDFMDKTLYTLGKCYMELSDSKNAISTFQKIKDKYPQSQYAWYADGKIKSLTSQP